LPASPETILCYVVDLVDRYTVATIDRRLSSIGYYHKQARHALPTKDPEVERTMRGIRRTKGIAPNGKTAILTPLLRQMVAALPDDLPGLRDKALLLIGFAGAFRRHICYSILVEVTRSPGCAGGKVGALDLLATRTAIHCASPNSTSFGTTRITRPISSAHVAAIGSSSIAISYDNKSV
jgi:hypothetical protein